MNRLNLSIKPRLRDRLRPYFYIAGLVVAYMLSSMLHVHINKPREVYGPFLEEKPVPVITVEEFQELSERCAK